MLLPPQDFPASHDGLVRIERGVPHEAFVHDHPETPPVTFPAITFLHQDFRRNIVGRAYGGVGELTVTGRGDKGRRGGGGTPGGRGGGRGVRRVLRVMMMVVVVVVVVRGGRSAVTGPGTVGRRGVDGDGGAVVEKGRVFQIDFLTQAHIA